MLYEGNISCAWLITACEGAHSVLVKAQAWQDVRCRMCCPQSEEEEDEEEGVQSGALVLGVSDQTTKPPSVATTHTTAAESGRAEEPRERRALVSCG